MKKLLLALLIVGLLPVVAFADPGEVDSWWFDGNAFVYMSGPMYGADLCAKARLWTYNQLDSACNCSDWSIPVRIGASVAQWVDWQISGTLWQWYVRKPGNYAGNCIEATIASNQNIAIDYHDFGPLKYDTTGGKVSVNDTIPIWYGVDLPVPPPPKGDPRWIYCRDLNARIDTIPDSYDLHYGISYKLWNYIHVEECNSACSYYDDAFLTLKLLCQKAWIDTCGCFKPGAPAQYGPP